MIDPRFYQALGPLPVRDLLFGASLLRGDPAALVGGVAALERAGPGEAAFAEQGRAPGLQQATAGLLVTRPELADAAPQARAIAITPTPRALFAQICDALFRLRAGRAADPLVHPSAQIEAGAEICAGASIGAQAEIGRGTWIGPNAVIGPGVAIGRGARIGPGAVVQCALVGDRVVIGANSVVGEAGFGVAFGPAGAVDLPHLGRVILQDRVTLGALVTVDRGQLGDTVLGESVKVDNLSQIAHNVRIGSNSVLAAFAGISGSAELGEGVRLAGRVGVADHVIVGPRATLAAGSGLMHTVPAGETWGGYPAKPIKRWMREVAWLRKMTGQGDAQ